MAITKVKMLLPVLGLMISSVNAAVITIPQSALNESPGVYTPGGYYTDSLGSNIVTTGGGNAANVGAGDGRNDDGFMELSLGFDFTFFGTTYDSLFINNNGNVSFGGGISAFNPLGVTGALEPIISVFFGDVDTRNLGSGVTYYNLTSDELVVTWDNVGYYDSNADFTNSFQLVLRSDDFTIPFGEGQIGFFYESMQWTATETSTTAAVGFGDGEGNGEALFGSNSDGSFHEVLNEQYLWFGANREIISQVSAPSSLLVFSLALLGFGASRRRKLSK